MFKYLIILGIMLLAFYLFKNKIKIKWKTFFKKGFKKEKNIWGVYCYCGKQGSSKTGNVVTYLYENRDKVIYANLTSINEEVIPYTYIKDLNELLELRKEHDCIIFFDEIFTEITKHQKISSDVMDFLSQMRKRRIIFITTCQEWRLLPLDFRLYVRYQINCSMFNLPFFGACSLKNIIDGDNIKWSDEEQDFVGNLIENTVSHCVKFVYDLYDTYEQIGKFAKKVKSESGALVSKPLEGQDVDFWEETFTEKDVTEEE